MSETDFLMFNHAYAFAAEFFYASCLVLFVQPFMTAGRHRQRKRAVVFCAYLLASWLCDWLSSPRGTFILALTLLLAAGAQVLDLERPRAFLLGLLYWETRVTSGLVVDSLYFIVDQILPYQGETPEAIYLRTALLLMLLLLSHAAVFAVMLYAFCRQLKKRPLPLGRLEMCYISLVPTAGILFGQMIAGLLFEIKDGELLQLYERHPVFLAAVPLLALLFYAGAYLTILFQQGMAALQEEQAAGFVERQQTRAIRARIHEAEQFYGSIRRLKHEMRGHLTNIKGLVQSGEYTGVEEYISRLDKSMSGFELTLRTGNPVTDVIVNDKQRQCREMGIRFQAEFYYPESGHYDAFDVGIILQNLLQNALEACEKVPEGERFLELAGKRKGRFFLIEVRNPFTGEITFGHDGLPVTDKKTDIPMHGIGLSNVRRIVEKYMGEMEIGLENQVFRITVMVQETGSFTDQPAADRSQEIVTRKYHKQDNRRDAKCSFQD